MSGFWVVFEGEGEEGCAGWSAQLEDGFVGMAVESPTSAWHHGRIFDPDFEATICAD